MGLGWTITPDSAGYSPRSRSYLPSGTVLIYRADSLHVAGSYEVVETSEGAEVRYDLRAELFYANQRISFKGPDTLVLQDLCDDCYRSVYQRID